LRHAFATHANAGVESIAPGLAEINQQAF